MLDADAVVRSVLSGNAAIAARIGERFGTGVLDGAVVNRERLGAVVFADHAALADLEALMHPVVTQAIREWRAGSSAPWGVVEAVKLVESDLLAACSAVWLLMCDKRVRRERLAARGWSDDEVARRVAAAPPLGPELAIADAVIDTSGPWDHTVAQVESAWAALAVGDSDHTENKR